MTATTAEATHVGCTQCGGTITVTDLVADVTCPYCGHIQQLDPRWLDVALWYAECVERQLASLVRARQEATVAKHRPDTQEHIVVGVGLMYLGGFLLFGLVSLLSSVAEGLAAGLAAAGVCGLLAVPFWYAMRTEKKQKQQLREGARSIATPVLVPKTLRCSTCGAQQQIGAGRAVRACQQCGASLTATLSQMAWAGWQLALDVRRRVAGLRISPLQHSQAPWGAEQWAAASQLAVAVHGQEGLHHRARWFHGYWPEDEAESVNEGSFVWGSCRGYPVAVHVYPFTCTLRPRFEIYVSALAFPLDQRSSWGTCWVARSLSGYRVSGLPVAGWPSLDEIARLVDQICELAQREGFPPAPYLEPVVEVLSNPLRRT